jgi:general secretion pathway protein E
MDTKVRQMEISPELNTHVKKYLAQLKYEVTEGAKLLGKSGVQQSFDLLGRRDDGITNHTVAVSLAAGGDREAEAGIIFSFANKAYDCGILDRMLIAIPDLSPEAKQLAQKQRIKVIDGERIER